MKASMSATIKDLSAIHHAMKTLEKTVVEVGVPEDKDERKNEAERKEAPMNNATLAYIHEFGSPDANIPARPFLTPGIKKAQPQIVKFLKEAGQAAVAGKEAGVTTAYNKAGLTAQNSVRAVFTDNDWPELADSTKKSKGVKTVTNKDGTTTETGKTNPLIETGQLRKSITYVVGKK